ncbi:MAG: DUF1772 domain-containing protein [Proteobacteria bacterium]|nr:DUF1772 domain-containing protein [Pseudomonadota bacterium]
MILRNVSLVFAFLATTAPLAHVLEMASKLTLPGPLWLGIQQNLYRGWGAVFGPVEIICLILAFALFARARPDRQASNIYLAVIVCYAAMLASFFLFNDPVNEALNRWTPTMMPANWPDYRLRWEIGHAITAVLAVIAFVLQLRTRPKLP